MSTETAPTNPQTPPKRLRADAAANLDRIVAAAESVFAESGPEASIELVAERANVGLGTIYRRFANKDALLAYLVRRLLEDVVDIAERRIDDTDGRGLFAYLFEVGEVLASNRGSVARIWSDPENGGLITRSIAAQAALVDDARRHGLIRPDVTAQDVAVALWSIQGVLDVSRGLDVAPWRRHIENCVAGWSNQAFVPGEPSLSPEDIAEVVLRSPSAAKPPRPTVE